MRRVILWMLSMGALLHAGLTDFKTIKEANQAYEAKEYGKSAALLKSLDAKSPQKQYDIGNALYKDKKYDEAIEAYEKAKGVDEATRLHNIGNSYFQKKEWDKAIEAYEKALTLKADEDTTFNLELAKKQKQQEEQKQQDQKDQEKKEDKKNEQDQDQQQNRNQQEQKQKNKENQEKKDKEQKSKEEKKRDEEKKKEGDQKQPDAQKEKEKKGDQDTAQPQKQDKMSKEEKRKEQELKRLMKKMGQNKTPTMMYQMGEGKKDQRNEDAKPW